MPIQISNDLIEQARTGERAAVEALLAAAWPQAFRLARAIVVTSAAAEDVAQEASVAAFRSITSLHTTEAFNTWFYRIVVNEAMKWKNSAKRTEPLSFDDAYEPDMAKHLDLWRALEALSPNQRVSIVLYYFEGLRTREIADVLRIPDATVRFRLMRGRRQLKHLLAPMEPAIHKKVEEPHAV